MIFACPHTSVSPMPSLNNSKLQTSGRLSSGAHNANRFHTINNIGLKRLIQQNVFGWFLRFHTLDVDGWVCLIKKHLGRINAAPSFFITVTTSENLHWSLQILTFVGRLHNWNTIGLARFVFKAFLLSLLVLLHFYNTCVFNTVLMHKSKPSIFIFVLFLKYFLFPQLYNVFLIQFLKIKFLL